MNLSQYVESYRFWDVVTLWAREDLRHEIIVARVLAKGVVQDGLRVQSVDPKWAKVGAFELHGAPFVGYAAQPGMLPIIIRSSALRHLRAVVDRASDPDADKLFEEFVTKQDFRAWLEGQDMPLPRFWFE